MKEGIIKDTYEIVIKELQTLITLSYVIAIGMGMLFNYNKYSEFGINVFEYSNVFDFLIAPFSDLNIVLFSVSAILVVYLFIVFDAFWKKKWPKSYSFAYFGVDKKAWFEVYRNIIFGLCFIIYLFISAKSYGRYSKEKILQLPDITIKMVDNEIKTGKPIGKTNDVIFLVQGESVYVIPFTALVREIKLK